MAASSGSDEEAGLLYTNLTLLLEFHKSTKEFKNYLKEDMFARPNKAGMKYTLHFLLPIFKADVFKTTIHWPVYTVKDEATFRSEVLKFISDYNSTNKFFELPKILNSILSSAGGGKFINFLLQLSTAALELTLSKEDKGVGKKLNELKTFDKERQLLEYTESCKVAETEMKKHQEFLSELKKFEEDAQKRIPELENERTYLLEQLAEMIETSKFLSAAEKESFRNIEDNSCLENQLRELDVQENAMALRLEKLADFKQLINQLSIITQKIVLSKENKIILDGSKIYPEELNSIASQLIEENWLTDPVNLFEDGKVNLTELMRVTNAAAKRLLIFIQQILNKSDTIPVDNIVKRLETSLEQLRKTDQEATELEQEMIKELNVIASAIDVIEEELFDTVPDPLESKFRNLVAPSPQITMPLVRAEEINEDAVYEYAIDSPYVKNFALRLINQLKAEKQSPGSPGDKPYRSTDGRSNARTLPQSKSALNRINLLRKNLGTSPLSRPNKSFLNSSSSSNQTVRPVCGNLSMNESFRPKDRQTSTPVLPEAPDDILEPGPSTAGPNEVLGDSPSVSSSKKFDTEENSDSDVWSPRGIFKLNSTNEGLEIDETIGRLSEHFAPSTPMHRRLSFLNLIERYKNIKAGSMKLEKLVIEDKNEEKDKDGDVNEN